MQADYVIVGAGSAGCVLANRLTEDPGTRVILIEAGGRDWHPYIHIPAGYMKLLQHPTLTWGYKADKDSGLNGREIPYPRGRVLGGSSSINGLIYIRSQPEDYDHWSQLGNRGWSSEEVMPFFRKAERWEGPADAVHATDGPLFTSRTRDQPELCQAAIQAGVELGWEYREDLNDLPHGLGDHIGWVQQTRGGRFRASAARTYLRPALRRPNLMLVTNALVHRVLFEGTRAVGVAFSRGGVTEEARAGTEVILSAGAIGTPHLLQLSGVGDPEHLGRVGIPVRHALRGVGRNFQDHFLVRVQAELTGIATLNERSRGLRLAGEVVKYFATNRGILTYAASLVAASVKVLPESATPDVQALFASASYAPGPTRQLDTKPGMTSGIWQMRPESRGSVLARTPDPRDQPSINPNYLSEERDRRTIVAAMRRVREWFNAPALKRYLVAETVPGPQVQTDDEFLAYARQTGTTVFHATCSCRMGPDAMAVVDDQLRVHGLQGLRVIDASVMPTVTSTNTNAPTIMIAEKGAAMVKATAQAARAVAA
ncbi:choline dehydrogenase [Siccirubricoccus deserti]|uniref:GMC family oxidoreductase N-terminal domain-containing protein n=1 Tax=Siccirubricoccus deserti TaxID=2013562 RepID=A0A9X0QZE5_9PROT|nr:GMC family oxidoreductase N-terminal domain-containing protein [Siccirubricoccus deserti]MBC4015877.1 GMC family oxidoreductase N-terminal domain-containing protein [Siccirubricoccus deserti]GGC45315.1 choline dehydrogenase [Siccirubricoccus deserti]